MMKIKVFIPFVFFVAVISCQKEVYLEINSDNVIVVNSILSPESVVKVQITKSQDLGESTETVNLNYADASIYKDTTFIEELEFIGDGVYKSSFTPVSNASYTIKVNSEDLTPVSSTTTIPAKAHIDTVYAEHLSATASNKCIYITLTDNGSINNYYRLKLKGYETYHNYYDNVTGLYLDSVTKFSTLLFYIEDALISSTNTSSSSEIINSMIGSYNSGLNTTRWLAFSDKNINGKTYTLEIHLCSGEGNNPTEDMPLYIMLESLDKDYYYYLYSKTNTSSYLVDQLSSTNSIYTNIENGAGIFSSTNIAIDSITNYDWLE